MPERRHKRRRLGSSENGCWRKRAKRLNQVWGYDFLMDRTADGTTQTRYTYAYDSAGNPTMMRQGNGDLFEWGYDSRSQLTSEQRNGSTAYAYTYTYDAAGNRLTKADGAQITAYTIGQIDQAESKARAPRSPRADMP